MTDVSDVSTLILKIVVAAFASTGILEYSKNFLKTTKTWIYSLLMPIFAVGCYCACEFLPVAVVGSLLTVGTVQLNYQIIVQGFKKVINSAVSKVSGSNSETENKTEEE